MQQISTCNPLTAITRQGCRLEEILFTLQTNHMIFLTGTKRPRAHCSPVTHSVLAGYRLFEWSYGMGRGTNRHAGLIVAVKLDICEAWQIREVASPQAGVQGRGGAIRVENVEVGPLADWALSFHHSETGRQTSYMSGQTKMVHAAPSRCWVVAASDLNAHVGCMQHPEREALNLERERERPWRDVGSINVCMRTTTESDCPSCARISTCTW